MPPKKGKGRGKGRGQDSASKAEPKLPSHPLQARASEAQSFSDQQKKQKPAEPQIFPEPRSLQVVQGAGEQRKGTASAAVIESEAGPSRRQDLERSTHDRSTAEVKEQEVISPRIAQYKKPDISVSRNVPKKQLDPKASVLQKTPEEAEILEKITGLSFESKPRERFKTKYTMAKRPDYGKKGRPIGLVANYFMLKFKDISVYHYDVSINEVRKDNKSGKSVISAGRTLKESKQKNVPVVEHQQKRSMGKAKCRQIIFDLVKSKALEKYCPVYDGQKNIFTNQPLPFKQETHVDVDVKLDDRMKKFCVTIKPVEKADGSNIISLEPLRELYCGRSQEIPQEVLVVFDTVMNHREPPLNQVQVRNSFFFLKQNDPFNLGCGLEVWFGYNQSVRLAQQGPVVIINLAAKAFHKSCSVIQYANDVLNCDITKIPKLENWQISNLTEALKNVFVQVTHQNYPRKYKIQGISRMSANELTIDIDKRKISVAQYFSEKYKKLRYPFLPCLHMKSNNTTYIPMETCVVVEGQPKVGKLSGDLTAKMIRKTAVAPNDRFKIISQDSNTVQRVSGPIMQKFGLIMDVNLMTLNGRIIAAPQLEYSGDKNDPTRIAKPDVKGVWRVEGGKKFYRTTDVSRWILMSFANERYCGMDKLQRYSNFLMSASAKCGMKFGKPLEIKIFNRKTKTKDALQYAKECGAQFAVIILSRRDEAHTYEEVKFLADFQYGLVTQCMEDKTLDRINDQITTNVCMKINAKLGGINHIILQKPQIFSEPIIVFGADAIHWPRDYGYPSIASVVGSLNPTATRYALSCRLQENKSESKMSQEIILCMKEMVLEIFKSFDSTYNGKIMPKRLIFFRDGVSEGQFPTALENEVNGIQQASLERYKVILPVTYIVVQKRHQSRFRPRDPRDGVGKMGNIPPGTTMDTTVTHPTFFDFFLCSHEGIQGTSKPAHYTVLHDDNKFNSDDLQQLCFFMCHIYVRCARSVSIPAPVLYADLAAARAKGYAELFIEPDTASSSGSGFTRRPLPDKVKEAVESMKSFEKNMFYV